jgi:glycogen debranching enzyme
MGVAAASTYPIMVPPRDTAVLTFVFAGSTRSGVDAERAFTAIAGHHAALLEKKKAHYASLIQRARIRIPDQRLQQVYDWVRINAEWLVRDVPGVGRGLSAGLPEYPWWFGTDGAYSMLALIASGDFELVKQTLRLLRHHSARVNGNGRIIHEVTTNGIVYNPGNTQETAHFIVTVGKTVRWTGDLAFAREMYPAMREGLRWLLTDMDPDHNLFPGGYGITEIYGLNAELIDVAVYTQQALWATAEVARVLGEGKSALRYDRLADELRRRINDRFWLEDEGSYADFYGTRDQAVGVTEGAIKQIGLRSKEKPTTKEHQLIEHYQQLGAKFRAMPDTTSGWITNKNWVVATPIEMGIAPRVRALQVLDRIRKNDVGEYGPWLSAVERQAMMTISTGVLAVAEAKYGRVDESLWYMNRIAETFNRVLPGSISEMMPDHGDFVQAWTIYGIVVPLVQHVLGVLPDAVHKTVTFQPHLPSGWEDVSIQDLPVRSNRVSFVRAKTDKGIEYRIDSKESGWNFVLKEKRSPDARYYLNGTPIVPDSSGIRMSGRTNQVLVQK